MSRFQIRRTIAARLGYVPANTGSIARQNRQALAREIGQQPRQLRHYEAQALRAAYRVARADADQARAALQLAASAAGRSRVADRPADRVFSRASCERLANWACDRNTPV